MSALPHASTGNQRIGRTYSIMKVRTLCFAWLILITLLAASASFKGIYPIDARTNKYLTNLDAVFELSFLGTAIEPFSAIAYVIIGAPDYRIAMTSTACWLFIIIAIALFWKGGEIEKPVRIRMCTAFGGAIAGTLLFALYMSFAIMFPLPSWSLIKSDHTTIVSDLHSHTFISGDGLTSLEGNLGYHRALGYDVVAITDHFSQVWRTTLSNYSPDAKQPLEIIPGVEISVPNFGKEKIFLLVLGIRPEVALPLPLLDYAAGNLLDDQAVKQFIEFVHNAHGAVLASCYQLHAPDIKRLAQAGVDGFELANFGHPNVTEDVRSALLEAQRTHKIALVANSDWHGWGNFAKTWTLIKTANVAGRRPEQVIDALRGRDPDRIVPVVSQVMGDPSPLRSAFAPFVEIVRYASELTPLRLLSWWSWLFGLFWLVTYLKRTGYDPGRCFVGGGLVLLGSGLIFRGLGLVIVWSSSAPFIFPLKVGIYSCGLGILSFLLACGMYRYGCRSHLRAE